MRIFSRKKGSIALMSLLIVSSITLILVLSMSELNISTSYQQLNQDSQKFSYYLGVTCLEEALLRLENDANFTDATITPDTDSSCAITIVNGIPITINITTIYLNYTQNFRGEVAINIDGTARNAELSKWEEI